MKCWLVGILMLLALPGIGQQWAGFVLKSVVSRESGGETGNIEVRCALVRKRWIFGSLFISLLSASDSVHGGVVQVRYKRVVGESYCIGCFLDTLSDGRDRKRALEGQRGPADRIGILSKTGRIWCV